MTCGLLLLAFILAPYEPYSDVMEPFSLSIVTGQEPETNKEREIGPDLEGPQEKKKAPKPIPLAFPAGQEVTYRWVYQGQEVGSTVLQYQPLAESGELLIESKFNYSREGRRLDSKGITILDAKSLQPRRYSLDFNSFAAPRWTHGRTVEGRFEEGTLHVKSIDRNLGTFMLREVELPTPCYIYDSQCFEHWVFLGAVLQNRGEGTYSVARPSEFDVIKLKFKKVEKQKNTENIWRWSAAHPSFKAEVWIGETGILHRYRQGDLEIILAK